MTKKATVIKEAEFNPKLKTYIYIIGVLTSILTIVGIAFVPFWLIIAPYFINKYYERMECELTTRSLRFQKGFIVKVERTIPLDKIQDLTFKEGPLLKMFGLSILRIETAGNSTQGGADLSLIGIVGAHEFRQMVFDQRDKVTDNSSPGSAETSESLTKVMIEIRDSLKRIEDKLLS